MHKRTIERLQSEGYRVVKNEFLDRTHWVVISYQCQVGVCEVTKDGKRTWWLANNSDGKRKVSQGHFMRRLTR